MLSDGERLKVFRKRWNYEPSDEKEFDRFRTRIDHLLETVWDNRIRNDDYLLERFAFVSGTQVSRGYHDDKRYALSKLSDAIDHAISLPEILESVQFVLMTLESQKYEADVLKRFCAELNKIFDISPKVAVRVSYHNGVASLVPAGARELDAALVSENLEWLDKYPGASKEFDTALKIYARKDPVQYRNMLDNLRFSLEHILRAVLNNNKPLEKQKEDILRWLAAHGAHSQIVNMYSDLLNRFALYQNDAVKHQEDKYTPAEVEFVLYLTGTFLRLIQRANEQSITSAAKTS